MIRIGFIGAVSKEWMGGLNYFKNLLYAIDSLNDPNIEVIVFVGKKTDIEIKNMFKKYAIVIENSLFDRKSILWYLQKLENKYLHHNFILDNFLKKYNLSVLSHSFNLGLKSCKNINWIPDFQHLHLPEMFSEEYKKKRNKDFLNLALYSDMIILSSYDAFKDFKSFAPNHIKKVNVLQFVSQPDIRYKDFNNKDYLTLINKYNLPKDFYFLPNQFWKHKNHQLIFDAIKQLVDENINICLVCTGHLNDYRNMEHINQLKGFIKNNKLDTNIRLLGLIDYEDVFKLIKFSKAVINPSLFEGWSSSVEECKSVGKNMILSDLDVHKEQDKNATFFERNSVASLKYILKNYVNNQILEKDSKLEERTKQFALNYIELVKKVLNFDYEKAERK